MNIHELLISVAALAPKVKFENLRFEGVTDFGSIEAVRSGLSSDVALIAKFSVTPNIEFSMENYRQLNLLVLDYVEKNKEILCGLAYPEVVSFLKSYGVVTLFHGENIFDESQMEFGVLQLDDKRIEFEVHIDVEDY